MVVGATQRLPDASGANASNCGNSFWCTLPSTSTVSPRACNLRGIPNLGKQPLWHADSQAPR